MSVVELEVAGAQLRRLVEEAARGGEVVIARAGQPMVRLVPVGASPPGPMPPARTKRQLGGLADAGGWVSDDFDAPLPDAVLALFEGRDGPGQG